MPLTAESDEFSHILHSYNQQIGSEGRLGPTSLWNDAEYVYTRLLNALYGWSLANANAPWNTEEAIDLKDEERRIVVQITASCTREKIRKTLQSKHTSDYYYHDGYHLKFAFVGFQGDAKMVQSESGWKLEPPEGIAFDRQSDTLFTADLLQEFKASDADKRRRILELVRQDIGTVTPSASARMSVSPELVERINARLKRQRKNHPSFQLMNGGYSEELSPRGERRDESVPIGPIPNSQRIVRTDGSIEIHFRDFLQNSWSSEEQNHLFITGRGGVGKTVALLTFATEEGFLRETLPAIYIPLYDLAQYAEGGRECVDRYLEREFSGEEYEAIKRLSHEPWQGGPSVILLMDGHNEIPADRVGDVNAGIRAWAERPGTQMVTTSRTPGLFGVAGTRWLELQPLAEREARAYLERSGLSVPEEGSTLWSILETPLMLKLYAETSDLPPRMQKPYLDWRPSNGAGDLVWNYLQRELWRMTGPHRGDYGKIEYATAMLLTLPYVCWQMESHHEFRVGGDRLDEYVEGACTHWMGRRRPPRFAKVERKLRAHLSKIGEEDLIDSQLAILTSETGLFGESTEGYALLHQSLRDGLAAIHLLNEMEAMGNDTVPGEFGKPISEYVKDFLADLCERKADKDNPLLRLWEASRKVDEDHVRHGHEELANPMVTHNLLRVIHKRFDGDLSMLDWSGMDLRGESLFPYRSGLRLEIARRHASYFKEVRLKAECFMPQMHRGAVNSVCFSPDSVIIASGSDDGTVRLWDATTGRLVRELEGHGGQILSVRFSHDGKYLASSSDDWYVRIWDAATGEMVRELGSRKPVTSVCFSPDGSSLVSGSSGKYAYLWDVTTGKMVREFESYGGSTKTVCFSPDGSLLASGSSDGSIHLWNAATGKLVRMPRGHWEAIESVRFSPDGLLLASGSSDGSIRLWDTATGGLVQELEGHRNTVRSVCFSPDSSLLVSGSDDMSARLWDVATGRTIRKFGSHGGVVGSVCFSPDGLLIANGSDDGSVRLWDAATGRLARELGGLGGTVRSACFSPDGLLLASGSDSGSVRLWDATTGRLVRELEGHRDWVMSVCFSPDGEYLASGSADWYVRLWEVSTGELVQELGGHGGAAQSIHFSPNRPLIASGSGDRYARLWNIATGELVRELESRRGPVTSVCFSSDGRLLVSGSGDRSIRIWDVATGRLKKELRDHGDWVLSVCFSPDGRLLASRSGKGTVHLWDTTTWQPVQEIGRHAGTATSVCFSSDGLLLASGFDDGSVCLWDTATSLPVRQLRGHGGAVESVCFSPDGSLLASGSADGFLRMWDMREPPVSYRSGLVDTTGPLFGIDVSGLDLSLAVIDDPHDREVLRQNGFIVPPDKPDTDPGSEAAPC